MRKNINFSTYEKVKKFFEKNKKKDFATTKIRDETKVDYESLKIILKMLIKDKFIRKKENRYWRD